MTLDPTRSPAADRSTATGRGRASSSTPRRWRDAIAMLAAGELHAARPVGRGRRRAHGAARRGRAQRRGPQPRLPGRPLSLGRRARTRRRSGSSAPIRDLYGLEPDGLADTRPWLDHGRWGVQPSARRRDGRRRPTARRYAFLAVRGREPAPDPGRPGACRHHRARPFPLHRQRRDRRAPGGAARLRPQGHRRPDGRAPSSTARRGSPAASRATARSPMRFAFARAVEAALGVEAPPRAHLAARADGRARAPRQPFRRHRRDLQRRLLRADARPLRRAARARAALRRRLPSAIA